MGLQVETHKNHLHFVFEGATPARDIYMIFHHAFEGAQEGQQVVIDLRASTSLADRTPEFVRMLTEFVIEHPERPGHRIAVILPENEVPRWEKLTSTMNDGTDLEIALFQDTESAEAWTKP